jgi:hypothetical protein
MNRVESLSCVLIQFDLSFTALKHLLLHNLGQLPEGCPERNFHSLGVCLFSVMMQNT